MLKSIKAAVPVYRTKPARWDVIIEEKAGAASVWTHRGCGGEMPITRDGKALMRECQACGAVLTELRNSPGDSNASLRSYQTGGVLPPGAEWDLTEDEIKSMREQAAAMIEKEMPEWEELTL